jgi:hypothetical protein
MALGQFWRSTIGKKVVMAVTGIVLVGYILAHVTANLLIFAGPAALDAYAVKLRTVPRMNRDFLRASVIGGDEAAAPSGVI